MRFLPIFFYLVLITLFLVLQQSDRQQKKEEGIFLYATHKSGADRERVRLKDAFGINAYEWNFEDADNPSEISESKFNAFKCFSTVRHYLDWEKLENQQGIYTFNPASLGGWNYDAIYERCKKEGLEVLVCLKTIPPWMQKSYPENQRDNENIPANFGSDLSDPCSYIEQAKLGFQFAARYGSNKAIDPQLIYASQNTKNGNKATVGLGLIKYIECDNERDKWWKGRKAYQTAYEYAANLSAFYDGHKGSMGPGVGVKNADPNMLVVMGGLAKPDTAYLLQMIAWCGINRGYKKDGSINLCWDVVNYHYYANDSEASQDGKATRGVAPEVSPATETAKAFITTSGKYAKNMPVWITEAGYDVNQGSPFRAIPIGNKSAEQTQADWLLRTALLYNRLGIGKVFFYQMYDDRPGDAKQFSTSGFLNNDQRRRPVAEYFLQVKQLFGEAVYRETISTSPIIDVYELDAKEIYVVTVPDEKGTIIPFVLNIKPTDQVSVYKIGQTGSMEVNALEIKHGKLFLEATETPMFVSVVPAAK